MFPLHKFERLQDDMEDWLLEQIGEKDQAKEIITHQLSRKVMKNYGINQRIF